jgi:hypothetical protein
MLSAMAKPGARGLTIAYNVVAVLVGIMMSISASGKLTYNPGAVKIIHEVIGVPLSWFPVLGACLIAGGVGVVVGIFRPRIGIAAAAGLVLYFVGAMVAHVLVGDMAGLLAPIVPLLMSAAALTLRVLSLRRA